MRGLAVAAAIGCFGACAAAAAAVPAPIPPKLEALLEELTAAATNRPAASPAPAPMPPPAAGRFRRPPAQASLDLAGNALREAVAALWALNGRLEPALALAGTEPEMRMTIARQLFATGRDAGALQLIDAEPPTIIDMRSQTLLAGAQARLKAGDPARAEAYAIRAMQVADTNFAFSAAMLLEAFGNMQLKSGRTNEALATWNRAITMMRDHLDQAAGNNPWVSLRDLAGAQAGLGHVEEALATTAIIKDDERRAEARQAVVSAQVAAGDLKGAAQNALAGLRLDADFLARGPYWAMPTSLFTALGQAGKLDMATNLVEQALRFVRTQVKGPDQAATLELLTKQYRSAIVVGIAIDSGRGFGYGPVDAERLEKAEAWAQALNLAETDLPLQRLREVARIRQDLAAGKLPGIDSLDVSTPDARQRAQTVGLILASDGKAREAARIAARLPAPLDGPVYMTAINAALQATNLVEAGELLARFPAPETRAGQPGFAAPRDALWVNLARRQAEVGRTNEAAITLREAAQRLAKGGAIQSGNDWFRGIEIARMQAELGLGTDALNSVGSKSPGQVILGIPSVGRRLERSLGAAAAIAAARGARDESVRAAILVGIAQELSRPGLSDLDWGGM